MPYIYSDEDNAPMNEDAMPGIEMSWKKYSDIIYEMQKEKEELPFTDPPLPERGCWNCMEYDGNRCMKDWNNADDCYYIPERDDKEPHDYCETWSFNDMISADEY